jgi:hypothetical protein
MKISIDELSVLLSRNNVGPEETIKILADAEELAKASKPEKSGVKVKNGFTIIAVTEEDITSVPCFIVQTKEDFDHTTIIPQLQTAAAKYNQTKKGQKLPIRTFGELFEFAQNKFFKEIGVQRKTKTPALVIATPTNDL